MNHPTREEWMSYLYDELNAGDRANLADHLRTCPACAKQLDDWRAAGSDLLAWRLPPKRKRPAAAIPAFRWAAAAAIVLLAGFAVGRLTSPAADTAALRAEVRQELAQSLHAELDKATAATLAASARQSRELIADYANTFETRQAGENQAIYTALTRLESQREADVLALKKEVDTVAVYTDAGLRHTQQQLIQLADYTQPAGVSDPAHK